MPVTLPKRYIRNCSALSESDCVELSRAHVAVVGCGGLGGSVIESLARVGSMDAGAGTIEFLPA